MYYQLEVNKYDEKEKNQNTKRKKLMNYITRVVMLEGKYLNLIPLLCDL